MEWIFLLSSLCLYEKNYVTGWPHFCCWCLVSWSTASRSLSSRFKVSLRIDLHWLSVLQDEPSVTWHFLAWLTHSPNTHVVLKCMSNSIRTSFLLALVIAPFTHTMVKNVPIWVVPYDGELFIFTFYSIPTPPYWPFCNISKYCLNHSVASSALLDYMSQNFFLFRLSFWRNPCLALLLIQFVSFCDWCEIYIYIYIIICDQWLLG